MARAAKHDLLVLSDGDMRVTPDYIHAMVAPFAAPKVGATTALYSGTGRGGLPSQLGAMYINDWFYPSSLIAVTFGELTYCFGATIAVRRKVLDEIGGFAALADYIADDHMLGRFVHEAGYTVALAPYVIENIVHERSLRTLFLQEVRWARTIRSLRPVGYTCSAITELLAISIVAGAAVFAASGSWVLAGLPVSTALAARYLLHRVVWDSQPNGGTYAPWLIPLRDLFGLTVRLASYLGSTVHWRGQVLNIGRRSISRAEPRPAVSSDGGPYGM
jgi:ceramide glucosyltransferase